MWRLTALVSLTLLWIGACLVIGVQWYRGRISENAATGACIAAEAAYLATLFALAGAIAIWMRRKYEWKTLRGEHIELRYAASLGLHTHWSSMLRQWEAQLDDLTARFGTPLTRRVRVLFVPSLPEYAPKFRNRAVKAVALGAANTILAEGSAIRQFPSELVRHELTHLFAYRWARRSIPIMCEGLATYLQETQGGYPIDRYARAYLRRRDEPVLPSLVQRRWKRDSSVHEKYMLAGSFTRFLIEHFGWEGYRQFYRRARLRRFATRFQRQFGITLPDAERIWRECVRSAPPKDICGWSTPAVKRQLLLASLRFLRSLDELGRMHER